MKVYVFGNEDVPEDRRAIEVAGKLVDTLENVSFIPVKPNEDVPFADERRVVVLDTVQGMRDVTLIEGGRRRAGTVLVARYTISIWPSNYGT
jgi:hypothetical protein